MDIKHRLEYKHVARTPAQIAERASMADSRVEYKAVSVSQPLERIKLRTPDQPVNGQTVQVATPPDNARFDKLLDQVTKLSEQVSQLLEENRTLRMRLEGTPPAYADLPASYESPKKSRVKKSVAAKARPS
jgi:hypothetical protein